MHLARFILGYDIKTVWIERRFVIQTVLSNVSSVNSEFTSFLCRV